MSRKIIFFAVIVLFITILSNIALARADFSVQSGNSTVNGETNVTIALVNMSKSFVIISSNSESSSSQSVLVTAMLTNSTNLQLRNYVNTPANVEYQIISDTGDIISSQSSNFSYGSGVGTDDYNITINPVNLSSSFILISTRLDASASGAFEQGMWKAKFNNETQINIQRTGSKANGGELVWQVVNWRHSNVLNGSVVITGGSSKIESPLISAVNMSKSFMVFSAASDISTLAGSLAIGYYNSTTAKFNRQGTGSKVNIEYFIVEEDSIRTQTGFNYAATTNQLNKTITSVNLNKSFILSSCDSTGAVSTWTNALFTSKLFNSTLVYFQKGGALQSQNISWYAVEIIDSCVPNLLNTTWSEWTNQERCNTNDLQLQNRSKIEYDSNSCGEVSNVTYWDYQNISCDYCTYNNVNTTKSSWYDLISCSIADNKLQTRRWTEYDENCGGCYAVTGLASDLFINVTWFENQTASCDYCSYSIVNSSWTDWVNIGCLADNTMNQTRSKIEYDSNYGACYAITNLSSDLWNSGDNVTYFEFKNTEFCDYCTPSMTNTTKSWENISCLTENVMNQTRNITQYDISSCGEIANQTFFEYRATEICIYSAPAPALVGGGSCTTDWNCSEWSKCSMGGMQIRTCVQLNPYCITVNRPLEERNCNYTSSEKALFDILVSVLPESEEIFSSERKVSFQVSLIKFKSLEGSTNVKINYRIYRGDEIISEDSDNVEVQKEISFIKNMELPELTPGSYYLDVKIEYSNKTAVGKTSFIVKAEGGIRSYAGDNGTYLALGLIIILSLIFILIRFYKTGGKIGFMKKCKKGALRLINKRVYSEEGDYIGEISEIYLSGAKIGYLGIKLSSSAKKAIGIENEGINIPYTNVLNIGYVVIVKRVGGDKIKKPDDLGLK